jgi:hypothetical protein
MSRSSFLVVAVAALVLVLAVFPAVALAGEVVHTHTESSRIVSPAEAIGGIAEQLREVRIGESQAKVTMVSNGKPNTFTIDYGEALSSVENRAVDGKDGGVVRLMLLPFAASFVMRAGGLLSKLVRV